MRCNMRRKFALGAGPGRTEQEGREMRLIADVGLLAGRLDRT